MKCDVKMDPAAGSGNFLTETYVCLRRLENKVLSELVGGQVGFSFDDLGEVSQVLFRLSRWENLEHAKEI